MRGDVYIKNKLFVDLWFFLFFFNIVMMMFKYNFI